MNITRSDGVERVQVRWRPLALAGTLLSAAVGAVALLQIVDVGGANASGQPSIVGSWQLTVTPPSGPPHPALITFARDGTLTAADVPVQPAPPGAAFRVLVTSGGHGAWRATGDGAARFTVAFLATDENGTLLGRLALAGTATLGRARQTVDAQFTVTFTDPAGDVISSGQGTLHGTRIDIGR
jgi:hypothetical protein